MMQKTLLAALAVLFAVNLIMTHASVGFAQDTSALLGDWKGDSICQVKPSSCHDEKVVYHISRGSDEGHVEVSADRIVDGKAINMGDLTFTYERKTATLWNDSGGRVWKFKVEGARMTGTLTLPDKTVVRRATLEKQP